MPRHGKPDATGRASGKPSARDKKLYGPPKGEPWAWLTQALLQSAPWRALSTNARRLIDALQCEHTAHAGRENGRLIRTHEQLREYGLTSDCIREAIDEAEFLGLVRCQRDGRYNGSNQPSLYRLTFYADRDGNPATNDWKRVTQEQISEWQEDRRQKRGGRKSRKLLREAGVP